MSCSESNATAPATTTGQTYTLPANYPFAFHVLPARALLIHGTLFHALLLHYTVLVQSILLTRGVLALGVVAHFVLTHGGQLLRILLLLSGILLRPGGVADDVLLLVSSVSARNGEQTGGEQCSIEVVYRASP